MKKLLVIGSSAIHTYNYIDLIRDYFDDILLLTNRRREGWDVNIIEMDFHLRLSMLDTVKKIKRITLEYNPTVVHIHQANAYAFLPLLALRKLFVPKVLTAWGSDVLLFPEINIFYKEMVRYVLRSSDVVTSDSLYMANKIKSLRGQKSNISLVSYGVKSVQKATAKENIIFSNRMHKGLYNIDKIIIAFKRFLHDNRDWKLVIAGSGEPDETQFLVELVKKLDVEKSVVFTGWLGLEDNLHYYSIAKLYVSIPDSDATSISLLEAITSNCICFVSNLPANCEHILDHVNGFIENDLLQMDFTKYRNIDKDVLNRVNALRAPFYSDHYCRNHFYQIYDELISKRSNM